MSTSLQGLGSPLTFKRAGEIGLESLAGYAQLDPTQQVQYQRDLETQSRHLTAAQAKSGTLGARSGAFQAAELSRGLLADAESRRLEAGKTLASAGLQAEELQTQRDISGAEITSREKIAGEQLEFEEDSFAKTLKLKGKQLTQDATLFRENLQATKDNIKTQQDWQTAEAVLERQFKEGLLTTEQTYIAVREMLQNAHEQRIIDDEQLFQAEQAVEDRKLKRDALTQDATLFRENIEATKDNILTQGDIQEALLLIRQQGEMDVLDAQQVFTAEQAVLSHARNKELLSIQQIHDAEQRALDRKQKADAAKSESEGGLFGAIGSIAGAFLGGPGGAAVGKAAGDFIGDLFKPGAPEMDE